MISTPSNNEPAPASVIIRQTETGWSALLGRFQDGKLERLETKEFPLASKDIGDSKDSSTKEENGTPTPTSELDVWLEQNEVNQVYTLLAAGRTITRVLELNVSEVSVTRR